jgi:hypothetical protein
MLKNGLESFGERDTLSINSIHRYPITHCVTAHGISIIHSTQNLPRVDRDQQKVLNYYKEGESFDYVITPKIVTIDESLRSLSPKK